VFYSGSYYFRVFFSKAASSFLEGGVSPVNFNEAANDPNIIIRSEQEKKRTGENDSPTHLRAETILLNFSMPLPMPIKLLPE
jgi:hypothetical protein